MELFFSNIFKDAVNWSPKIATAVAILFGFYLLAMLVKKIINSNAKRLEVDQNIVGMISKISGVIITLFGVITALGTLGVNVSAIVAGLGLTGFAFGFALKDTISNVLSGVMILIYQPFKIQDQIKVAGFEGVVTNIDLRYTELNGEQGRVLIPNKKLFTDPIVVLNKDNQYQD